VAGAKFRRQFPIGAYVADFCCLEVGLIVELDGGQHVERESHDAKRTMALEEKGFRVLRFWNDDVLQNTEAVLEQISNAVDLGRMKPRLRGHKAVEE
jgi:very-short-patch-repair endonuclease